MNWERWAGAFCAAVVIGCVLGWFLVAIKAVT